jgi:hypothetical protein
VRERIAVESYNEFVCYLGAMEKPRTRSFHMSPLDKVPGVDNDPSKLPDDEDLPADWAEEDRQIEGRKPDLGEIEEDSSEL